MTAYTSAGTTLRISATIPTTFDATGFGAVFPNTPGMTSPLVGEVTDLGEYGREYAVVSHNPLASRGTQKYKGSFNAGGIQGSLAIDRADAGQAVMQGAVASDASYSFEIKDQQGNKEYFIGKVFSFKTQVGSVDQITSGSFMIEIDSNDEGLDFVFVEAV